MPLKIQIRRGTLSEWQTANPILLKGEIGFVTEDISGGVDANKLLIVGDGQSDFNTLYVNSSNIIMFMNNVANSIQNVSSILDQEISDEASARNAADTNLSNLISDEASARESLAQLLVDSINNEATIRQGAIDNLNSDLSTKILTEESNRTNADTELSDRLSLTEALSQSIYDSKGQPNGIAELNSSGVIPSSQLPSFVDDVLEYSSALVFPTVGETGKIYVSTSDNTTWRWSGTIYVQIAQGITIGETSSTAYRGDRGKIAFDHSQLTSGNPHNVTKADVGLSDVPNVDTSNPSNISQNSLHRFVSDSEKSTWNAKISKSLQSVRRSGYFYPIQAQTAGALTTTALSANTITYTSFILLEDITITAISSYITATGTATKFRFGLYNANQSTGWATSIITESGELAANSTGIKTVNLVSPLTLTAGCYNSFLLSDGSVTLAAVQMVCIASILGMATVANAMSNTMAQLFTYGTPPTTAGATSSSQVAGSGALFVKIQ